MSQTTNGMSQDECRGRSLATLTPPQLPPLAPFPPCHHPPSSGASLHRLLPLPSHSALPSLPHPFQLSSLPSLPSPRSRPSSPPLPTSGPLPPPLPAAGLRSPRPLWFWGDMDRGIGAWANTVPMACYSVDCHTTPQTLPLTMP